MVASSNITYAPTPDHKVIDIYTQLSKNTRGKGYWKINVSILEGNDYTEGVQKIDSRNNC